MQTTLSARLVVADVDRAVAYYESCLGAERGIRVEEPSGHVVHAELSINGSLPTLTQAHDDWGLFAPEALGGTPILLRLTTADAHHVAAAMVGGSATVIVPVEDRPHGKREGRVRDPFGHLWIVTQDLATEA